MKNVLIVLTCAIVMGCASVHVPKLTADILPKDLPPCNVDLIWKTATLGVPNIFPRDHHRLLMCVPCADGKYRWAEIPLRVLR